MAVTKELKQFNVYDVFEPLYADKLSDEEKSKALSLLIFLKESKMAMSRRDRAQMAVSRGNMWQRRKQQRQLLLLSLFS